MLSAEDFFDLTDWTHPELFTEKEPVWQAFSRLKSYLSDVLRPNLTELNHSGPVLQKTVVLQQGKLLTSGFELRPGDATKETFQVIRDGVVLEGAAVLYGLV